MYLEKDLPSTLGAPHVLMICFAKRTKHKSPGLLEQHQEISRRHYCIEQLSYRSLASKEPSAHTTLSRILGSLPRIFCRWLHQWVVSAKRHGWTAVRKHGTRIKSTHKRLDLFQGDPFSKIGMFGLCNFGHYFLTLLDWNSSLDCFIL